MNLTLYRIEGSAADVLEALARELRLAPEADRREKDTYQDTFDWELAGRGWTLARHESAGSGELILEGPQGGPLTCPGTALGDPGNLPPGRLAEAVAPVAGLRHLLTQVEVARRVRTWRVLDGQDKTIVRLELWEGSARDHGASGARPTDSGSSPSLLPAVLAVRGLRGYDRDFDRVSTLCSRGLRPLQGSLLDLALEGLGRDREREASAASVILTAQERADGALARLLLGLAETARENVAGTIADLDTEFLHDLRVAVRRTRSALSQVKGVLPDPPLQQHRDELKWLGTVTGPVRDLDVFLLGFDDLARTVAGSAREDLEPLRGHLVHSREVERKKLQRALRSRRAKAHFQAWPAFLEEIVEVPVTNEAPRGGGPVAPLAARRIRRTARDLRRGGRAIDAMSPPEDLHDLRIQAKKLRYLLELFRSLLEPEAYARQHGALKKLQSVLGDYNDCAVQEEALAHFAREMHAEGTGSVETTLAIGRLAERIALRAEGLRRRFAEVFDGFDDPRLRSAFRAMLEPLEESTR